MKVLGGGCANCKKLEKQTQDALQNLGLNVKIEKVTDMQEIMAHGVMSTPALVVDNEVKLSGRVPSVKEIEALIKG